MNVTVYHWPCSHTGKMQRDTEGIVQTTEADLFPTDRVRVLFLLLEDKEARYPSSLCPAFLYVIS